MTEPLGKGRFGWRVQGMSPPNMPGLGRIRARSWAGAGSACVCVCELV